MPFGDPDFAGNWDGFAITCKRTGGYTFVPEGLGYVTQTRLFPAASATGYEPKRNGSCMGSFAESERMPSAPWPVIESCNRRGSPSANGEFNAHRNGEATQVIVDKNCDATSAIQLRSAWARSNAMPV